MGLDEPDLFSAAVAVIDQIIAEISRLLALLFRPHGKIECYDQPAIVLAESSDFCNPFSILASRGKSRRNAAIPKCCWFVATLLLLLLLKRLTINNVTDVAAFWRS